jgi:phage-related protein
MESPPAKDIVFMGESLDALSSFPVEVKREIGFALRQAQNGETHVNAKPLAQFSVMEIVSDYDGNTFRGVYTVKLKDKIYVLHCFQKKAKKGKATTKRDLDLIERRLKQAKRLATQGQLECQK